MASSILWQIKNKFVDLLFCYGEISFNNLKALSKIHYFAPFLPSTAAGNILLTLYLFRNWD